MDIPVTHSAGYLRSVLVPRLLADGPKVTVILAFLCVWLALPTYAEATGLTVSNPQTDGNGVIWYDATSSYNGPGSTTLRVLSPTNPAPGMPHRFIYVLPAIPGVDLQDEFGDGLEELLALNVHNDYNAHIIAPSFQVEPWYANHDSNPDRQYESFMVHDLVPWVQANLSVTGQEEHWLIGFSKSGFGAVTLLFRNPTVFDAAAAWDFPADQPDTYDFGMLDNYGTDTNFQNNYRLTEDWIAARKEPFQTTERLWLSEDYVTYYGIPTFRDEVLAFAERLSDNDVQYHADRRCDSYTLLDVRMAASGGGWSPEPAGTRRAAATPGPSSAQDDFNRADGSWGPTGSGILVGQQGSPLPATKSWPLSAMAGPTIGRPMMFEADQYSQITITGAIGDWTGVVGPRQSSPRRGIGLPSSLTGSTCIRSSMMSFT